MQKKALAQDSYDAIAADFAARAPTKGHNAYYERPATLSLLPRVNGKRVLDAGCGPGIYAAWLLEHGAQVLAVDASANMLGITAKHLAPCVDSGRLELRQANLEEPLSFLADASVDVVLSPLVLDYVLDLGRTFAEFYRVLRAPGHFVFSMGHPQSDFAYFKTGNYFPTERVEWAWRMGEQRVTIPTYRRPLQAVIQPLLDSGFILERLLEPLPQEEFRAQDPEEYDKLMHTPGFLCLRAAKR